MKLTVTATLYNHFSPPTYDSYFPWDSWSTPEGLDGGYNFVTTSSQPYHSNELTGTFRNGYTFDLLGSVSIGYSGRGYYPYSGTFDSVSRFWDSSGRERTLI
jgi:hypothetical protein